MNGPADLKSNAWGARDLWIGLVTGIVAVFNGLIFFSLTFSVMPAVEQSAAETRAAREEVREVRAGLKQSHQLIERANKDIESYAGIMAWWDEWRRAAEAKKAGKEKKK